MPSSRSSCPASRGQRPSSRTPAAVAVRWLASPKAPRSEAFDGLPAGHLGSRAPPHAFPWSVEATLTLRLAGAAAAASWSAGTKVLASLRCAGRACRDSVRVRRRRRPLRVAEGVPPRAADHESAAEVRAEGCAGPGALAGWESVELAFCRRAVVTVTVSPYPPVGLAGPKAGRALSAAPLEPSRRVVPVLESLPTPLLRLSAPPPPLRGALLYCAAAFSSPRAWLPLAAPSAASPCPAYRERLLAPGGPGAAPRRLPPYVVGMVSRPAPPAPD